MESREGSCGDQLEKTELLFAKFKQSTLEFEQAATMLHTANQTTLSYGAGRREPDSLDEVRINQSNSSVTSEESIYLQ